MGPAAVVASPANPPPSPPLQEDLADVERRDTMPASCDALRRTEIDLVNGVVLGRADVPLVDAAGNRYRYVRFQSPTCRPHSALPPSSH